MNNMQNNKDRSGKPASPLPFSNMIVTSPISPMSTQPLLLDSSFYTNEQTSSKYPSSYQVYKIRWIMLLLFVAYSTANAMHWIQYSIITNVIVYYYDVETTFVDWCSMSYMVCYIPLIFPATWFLEKKGLRKALLIGSLGTMIGAWVKCLSVSPDRFGVSFSGQMICAASQIFILGIPAPLARVWFSSYQVSTACAIGVFGNQLGVAMGFLIPPILVPNSQDKDEIAKGLSIMFYSFAAINTVIFILILFVFKEAPVTPPSAAAQSAIEEQNGSYTESILRLVKNKGYVLLLLSYGLNVGVFYGISTLLNQTILQYFEDATKDAGRIGLLIVISGMVGSIVCGYILDKTAKFKFVTLAIYVLAFIFMIVYTFIFLLNSIALVFVMAAVLGFFMTGYLPVGFEFAAELTFPEAEGTSSGLLNASAQFFGIVCTLTGGQVLVALNDQAVNLIFSAVLFIGVIMTAFIKENLRRQAAHPKQVTISSNTEQRI